MATITPLKPKVDRRTAVAALCLVAGALFGLLSVFSDTRASCALWVVVALTLVFVSGLIFGARRPTR